MRLLVICDVTENTPSDEQANETRLATMALRKLKRKRRKATREGEQHNDKPPTKPPVETEPRKRKSKRRQQSTNEENQHADDDDDRQLTALLSEMEQHMALDRILQARKVVDQIQKLSNANFSPKQQEEMDHIIQESSHVQALMADLQSDDNWTLCRSRSGITVHYRNEKGDPIHAVKTHVILNNYGPTEFVRLCSLFAESDLLALWFPGNILDSVELLVEPSKYRQVIRMVMKFHYLPITDREVICEGIGYHIQDENAFLLLTKSIDSSPHCQIPPNPPKMVRMETKTAFFIKLLPGNKVEFCQISHDDLKLKYVPAFVTNYLSQGAVPFELIQSMKQVMHDYNGSEWDKRVEKRRNFYAEIEERVHEELAIMNGVNRAIAELKDESDNDAVMPKMSMIESHSGMSLEMAMGAMAILVLLVRWAFDRFHLSLWVCSVCLVAPLVGLTHCVFLYRHQVERIREN